MKIMIVDDHADMRRLLRRIVSGAPDGTNEIIECSDGGEAVEQFPIHCPDYVLMDVELKEMNGFTATEKIYQHDPDAKIIFVTSYNTSAFRARAAALGAKGFVSKDNLLELNRIIQSTSSKGGSL